ncbi:hypothetical protein L6164_003092 [Bauhinia variegata]|uniref:Uncharacterized protein n=1 Tax=Bauhinia variegata TaxID=167791 RepID=A0ACB9Q052_BAUVA|nr:hypothetical protein L6164_003092 [Bauhinia variegata]
MVDMSHFEIFSTQVSIWTRYDPFHPNEITPIVVLVKTNNFVKHVEKTLTRFRVQCLAIKEFKLHMQYCDSRIDGWMRFAIESGVQVLDLMVLDDRGPMRDNDNHRCLPPSILEAKSLIKLTLTHAKIYRALVNNPSRFSSLQKLSLILALVVPPRALHSLELHFYNFQGIKISD